MSSEMIPTSPSKATVYTTPEPAGEGAAEHYIAIELQKTRVSLQRNIVVGLVVLALLGGEMLYLTNGFTSNLEPHAAAQVAEGFVAQQVADKGPDVAAQIKQKIPELIQQVPDYALKQMPAYRESLENRLEEDLTRRCQATAPQLGQDLHTFLSAHKDQVKQILASSNDPAMVSQMGEELKATLHEYLQQKPDNGESVTEQIDKSLSSLQEVEKKVQRLAANKNLTPEEKKARRAIAVLSRSINTAGEQIQPAVKPVVDAVSMN